MAQTRLRDPRVDRYGLWQCGVSGGGPTLEAACHTGVRYDGRLADGRQLFKPHKTGQQVWLEGLSFPVTIAWFYLKRDGETRRSKRYVLCTRPLKACTIV